MKEMGISLAVTQIKQTREVSSPEEEACKVAVHALHWEAWNAL